MLTGLSPHEALGLGWEHVDLDAGVLRVGRTVYLKAQLLVDDTKRPSRRRGAPIPGELHTMLRERWLGASRPPSGLVFSDPAGAPLDLDRLRDRFKASIAAAGITRRVRIYDLRHSKPVWT